MDKLMSQTAMQNAEEQQQQASALVTAAEARLARCLSAVALAGEEASLARQALEAAHANERATSQQAALVQSLMTAPAAQGSERKRKREDDREDAEHEYDNHNDEQEEDNEDDVVEAAAHWLLKRLDKTFQAIKPTGQIREAPKSMQKQRHSLPSSLPSLNKSKPFPAFRPNHRQVGWSTG